jgi:uncharacterized membrane protein YcaP (DUF421 family)
MNRLWEVSFPHWEFVLRAVIVYCYVLFLLRLAGKRQVGQMGVGELVALLLISNAVQNAMNGGDNSVTGGLILATALIGLSIGVEYATFKSKRLEGLLQGRPTVLVRHGRILHRNLEKERLSLRELKVLLRKQGVHDISEIEDAVLESDGFVSITKKSEVLPKDQ